MTECTRCAILEAELQLANEARDRAQEAATRELCAAREAREAAAKSDTVARVLGDRVHEMERDHFVATGCANIRIDQLEDALRAILAVPGVAVLRDHEAMVRAREILGGGE